MSDKPYKLSKPAERFIEDELYHFYGNLKKLSEFKETVYEESPAPPDGMPRGTDVSNPTESKAIRLLTTHQILTLEKRLIAIQKVLDRYQYHDTMTKLIELRYFKRTHTPTGIAAELNISQSTFYKYRSELLHDIGNELGLL